MRNKVLAALAALILISVVAVGFISGSINEVSIATWSSLFSIGYISAYYAHIYAVLVPEGTLLFIYLTIGMFIFFVINTSIFIYLSHNHHRKGSQITVGKMEPFVSIIVPCYNEGKTVANCLRGLLDQTYRNFEIVLVNDGSKDDTEEVCKEFASLYPERIRYFYQKNEGKASALRLGLVKSKPSAKIIVTMDADSIFDEDALKHLVSSFDDPRVGAVGGNVRVANKDSIFGRNQAVEYLTGLAIRRRAFARLNCMQVIAGAIGAFRRDVLIEIGGHSSYTVAEDMDATVSVLRAGYRVEYNGKAIAYTEAPANMKDFLKQRYRWIFGGFQVLRKHRSMLFNRKYGSAGMIGLPYLLISPWIDVLFTSLFVYCFVRAVVSGALVGFFIFYSCMMLIQCVLVLYAIRLDGEDRNLVWTSCTYGLWYNHLLSIVILFAGIRYLGGAKVIWDQVPRLGKNVLAEQK